MPTLRQWLRNLKALGFFVGITALWNPLTANAMLVTPSIDLTQVQLTTSLVSRTSPLYCYPGTCSSLYENLNPSSPTVDDLNITRNNATDPVYIVESSSVSGYGATSYATASGAVSSIATGSGNYFHLSVGNDIDFLARVIAAPYECGTPDQPRTCYEGGVAYAGGSIYQRILFTLLQPHTFDFWGNVTTDATLTIAGNTSGSGYWQYYVAWNNSSANDSHNGVFSGAMPAGDYIIETYIGSQGSAPYPEGAQTGGGSLLFTLDLAPVPLPGAFWLFASGLLGLIAATQRRKV